MANKTRTFICVKEQSVADFGGSNRGNGKDDHAPIGEVGSTVYRELLSFDHDWTKVHQIKAARLRMKRDGQTHLSHGINPRVLTRRITESWAEHGGSEGSWAVSSNEVFPGPSTAGTSADSGELATGTNAWSSWDITGIIEDLAPASVKRRNGQPCGGEANRGIRVISFDETSTNRSIEFYSRRSAVANRPRIELEYDDNRPPTVVTVLSPVPGGDPTQVATTSGRELTVEFDFNDPDSDACAKAEMEVYPNAITDATASAANRTASTGPITPTGTGTARRYRVKLTGLPARTDQRHRLRAQDTKGAWGPWTLLTAGRIETAYLPGVPLAPQMTTNPEAATIKSTINSADEIRAGSTGDYVRRYLFEAFAYNTDGSRTPLASMDVDLGDNPANRSITVGYSGTALKAGDVVRWRHRHHNRDLVEGPWSPEYETVMKTQVGPTITPADAGTKLTSRTASITLGFNGVSSSGYQYRLYRGTLQDESPSLIHDAGLVTISPATSAAFTLPAGKVNWGDRLLIEAASAPAAGGGLGAFSPRSELYVNALPDAPVLVASDGEGNTGAVIPTTDVLWTAPYSDTDIGLYGDLPTAREIEVREASSPPGGGAFVFRRLNAVAGEIPEEERTGRILDALGTTTGTSADANVTVTTYNTTNYSGYFGDNLAIQATGASSTDRGARKTMSTGAQDLSVFGAQAQFVLHWRVTSVTNLTRWVMRFEFATAGDWAEFEIVAAAGTIDTWFATAWRKASPRATSGTVDWSLFSGVVRFFADVSGAYTGDLYVRDLRLGSIIAAESSVDARVRYRDDAAALISTTLAAAAAAGDTNVKLTSVASLTVGMDMTFSTGVLEETRTLTTVGTAGSGGTGVSFTDALTLNKGSGTGAYVYPWGAWPAWATVKVSLPPVVAADTPAANALITDPTPDLAHTFSSAGGKAQAMRTRNIYRRLGYAGRALAMAPASYWRLNEASGSVLDSAGAVSGTVAGTVTRQAPGALGPGDTDTGLNLGGGDVSFGDVYDFAGTAPFTLAGWIKHDTIGGAAVYGTPLDKETVGDGWYFLTGNGLTTVRFYRVVGAAAVNAFSPDALVTGTWQHLAAVYDGATITVYLDGVAGAPVASVASLANTAAALVMGSNVSGGANDLLGTMDEWGVWTRALSAAEVAALYGAQVETPADELLYTLDELGTGLTDTLPTLLLEDVSAYAHETIAYDTDGLAGTTARRAFSTSFAMPAAVADLTATVDAETGAIVLAWTASADPFFDHYRITWRNAAGQQQRIDLGPVAVDDGRTPLTVAEFTWYGGRLGTNEFSVTVHNGSLESEAATVEATVPGLRPGSWELNGDGEERYTFAFDPDEAPRTTLGTVETFRPPGRPYPIHLHRGSSGRHVTMRFSYPPAEDGDLSTVVRELSGSGRAVWVRAASGYQWDVMRVRVVGHADAPQRDGLMQVSLELDEVDPEAT